MELFTHDFSFLLTVVAFFAYNCSLFAYSGKACVISTLTDCEQRSSTVSKKVRTVSKSSPPPPKFFFKNPSRSVGLHVVAEKMVLVTTHALQRNLRLPGLQLRNLGPENERKLFLHKVFKEPFESWTSAPKIVDVRTKNVFGPGDGKKSFNPRASGRTVQECLREIATEKLMFMLLFFPDSGRVVIKCTLVN